MTRAYRFTLGVLSVVACGIWLLVFYGGSRMYQAWSQQPLGPTLGYSTPWQLPPTWTASPNSTQPAITLAPTLVYETNTPASPFLSCNDLPGMTILAIG